MDEGNKTGGKGWGLFDSESVPGQALWRPLTHTFAQFGELVQTTPLRLAVRRHHIAGVGAVPFFQKRQQHRCGQATLATSDAGVSVLAGRSSQTEGPATLKLLIVLLESNTSAVRVAVAGLPRLVTMRYSVVLTNRTGVALGGIAQVSADGALELPPFAAPAAAGRRPNSAIFETAQFPFPGRPGKELRGA